MGWLERLLDALTNTYHDNDWPEVEGPSARLDRARLVKYMHDKSPTRWARFIRDFRFFQKHMKKLGRNPEDVRFLLP